jgi:hypothetical protein
MQGRQLFGESMFLQSLSCFVGRRVHIMSIYAIVGRFLFGLLALAL